MSLTTLFQWLKTATKQLPALKVLWGLVGAAIVAAIVTKLLGSGSTSVIAVGFVIAGTVLTLLLSVLARIADKAQAGWVLVAVKWMTISVVAGFVYFVLITCTAVATGWPCRWATLLGLSDAHCVAPIVKAAGVHIRREIDATKSGCVDGKRVHRETMLDTLAFEGDVPRYKIQALKDRLDTQQLAVTYGLDGTNTEIVPDWQAGYASGPPRMTQVLPVNSRPARIRWEWNQRPTDDDDFWAFGVISSLPILSFHATLKVPPGKHVLGPDPGYPAMTAPFTGAGCTFLKNAGGATLDCDKPLPSDPNTPLTYPYKWDVFSEFRPIAKAASAAS